MTQVMFMAMSQPWSVRPVSLAGCFSWLGGLLTLLQSLDELIRDMLDQRGIGSEFIAEGVEGVELVLGDVVWGVWRVWEGHTACNSLD